MDQLCDVIPFPPPYSNRSPYLNCKVKSDFIPKNQFFQNLGNHLEEEGKIEVIKIWEKENLTKEKKCEHGYYLESVRVISSDKNVTLVDISNINCNIAKGNAVNIINKHSGWVYEAFCLASDGEIFLLEGSGWIGIPGEIINVEIKFTRFEYLIGVNIDHYYRLFRTEQNINYVEAKLQKISPQTKFNLEKINKVGNLDPSQMRAFNECLNYNPVTLVQGPPGTGKTTFAANLSKHLIEQGHTVLVTAFTHDAINNILKKIQKLGSPIKKVGRKCNSTELLKPFTENNLDTCNKYSNVIGMTIHTYLKNHEKFDFILVDEASQMDIVSGLHFLASSSKTIFIGDQMQLPNIPKIPDTEFSISIFDLLMKTYDPLPLQITYRFNQKICDYISNNFYDGLLECSDTVKDIYLKLDLSRVDAIYHYILDETPLVFINTAEEVEFILNKEQANITADIVNQLLKAGLSQEDIGVIAPNNMQVNYIKRVLGARKVNKKGILIETVNKFQGQEKRVIIFNSVVTVAYSEKAKYDFFFDIRRFNVAVSRAKQKVIVLGSKELFSSISSLIADGGKITDYMNRSKFIELTLGKESINK